LWLLALSEAAPRGTLQKGILMNDGIAEAAASIIGGYTSSKPDVTARALREYWLGFVPNRGIELIKAEQREQFEAIGIPIPTLKAIGGEIAKAARHDVSGFLPLARLLWDEYGREGRVVALIVFGAMELVEPQRLVPLLKELCRQCASWEDADRLAMDAVEPIVRKYPETWLGEMEAWLKDENKWIRRASITIIGRLPMKHPAYVGRCLTLTERLLSDSDVHVRRAVSFAIRTCARTDPHLVRTFLEKQVSEANAAAVWVLCDAIKSMDRRIIAQFAPLLPRYEEWFAATGTSSKDRRSLDSAIKALQTPSAHATS
jgi:3-methyladenine DNA glycosylase AlkD